MRAPGRPRGTITRGTTNPNRLRRLDRWILHRMGATLRAQPDALVVDLGYGASPVTTLELADRLGELAGPCVRVVGIEIDPERVAAAQRHARAGVLFRLGGFEVPAEGGERPILIRAANVLRQYDEADVADAWRAMRDRLAPGGLLVEGTCDELGRLGSWVAIPAASTSARGAAPARTEPVRPQTLTLGLDLRHLERPSRVAERLPKALIHRNVPGEPVHALLAAMDGAWDAAAGLGVFGPRQRWMAAVEALRPAWPVLDGPARWRVGELTLPWDVVAPAGDGNG